MSWMEGDFDNEAQYNLDKQRRCSQHDLISIQFIPHPALNQTLIATYYYGKNFSSLFRYRLYTFHTIKQDRKVRMKIYRPRRSYFNSTNILKERIQKLVPMLSDFEVKISQSFFFY
jgi:hypothetical protein